MRRDLQRFASLRRLPLVKRHVVAYNKSAQAARGSDRCLQAAD
jgi:hypothetical protein